MPGGDSKTTLYEDDGTSQAYETDYATTEVSREVTDGKVTVKIAARSGSYKGISLTRKLRVVLDGATAPTGVTVNGRAVPFSRFAARDAAEGKEVWGYNGAELAVTVYIAEASASVPVTVECDSRFAFTELQRSSSSCTNSARKPDSISIT